MKLSYMKLASDAKKTDNGFSGHGEGWDLYKMFYDGEHGYGEFYFNINTKTGEAEILSKDSGYANILLPAIKGALNE